MVLLPDGQVIIMNSKTMRSFCDHIISRPEIEVPQTSPLGLYHTNYMPPIVNSRAIFGIPCFVIDGMPTSKPKPRLPWHLIYPRLGA